MPINQPSNQIRITNVAAVRLKKGKKRFEIACYPNKVLEWRAGIETKPENVLQVNDMVFLDVNKGQQASQADLEKAFPDCRTLDDTIVEILKKGVLQVGEKERRAQLDRVHDEVVNIVAGKLVDPKTKKAYTAGMINKALDQLRSQSGQQQAERSEEATAENGEEKPKGRQLAKWTGVVATKDAKPQALLAMKALIAHQPIPVMKARMRLRVTCPTSILKHAAKSAPKPPGSENAGGNEEKAHGTVKDTILRFVDDVESQDVTGDEWEVVGCSDPGAYKTLGEFIESQTKGRGRIEVLDTEMVHDDD